MKVMLQKSAEKHLTPGVSPGRFCHQIMCIYINIYCGDTVRIYIYTYSIYMSCQYISKNGYRYLVGS